MHTDIDPRLDDQALRMGYRAGNYSDGPKDRRDNPFNLETHARAYAAWNRGFSDGRFGAGDGVAS